MDRLTALFAQVLRLPVEELSDGTSPDNTSAWDSLAAMEIVVQIEDAFEVRLTTSEIMRMRSIGLARETLRALKVPDV